MLLDKMRMKQSPVYHSGKKTGSGPPGEIQDLQILKAAVLSIIQKVLRFKYENTVESWQRQ